MIFHILLVVLAVFLSVTGIAYTNYRFPTLFKKIGLTILVIGVTALLSMPVINFISLSLTAYSITQLLIVMITFLTLFSTVYYIGFKK